MKPSWSEYRSLFASRGLRFTRQRAALYASLASTTSHPTAEELLAMTRRGIADDLMPPSDGPKGGTDAPAAPATRTGLSLSTVYNTLETLVSHGLCRRLSLPTGARGAGPCRFDADVSEHVHVVFADGRVMDVPDPIANRLVGGIFGGVGVRVSGPRDNDRALRGGVLGEVERVMGVRIARASIQLIAEETA